MNSWMARQILNVSYNTLRIWRQKGLLRVTVGEHNRVDYWEEDIYAMMGRMLNLKAGVVVYTRVATNKIEDQQLMVKQREVCLAWLRKRRVEPDRIIEDWGRAIDTDPKSRPGLAGLRRLITTRKVGIIIVETKDRLLRDGFEFFEELCRDYGVQLQVVNPIVNRPEYQREQEVDLRLLAERLIKERTHGREITAIPTPVDRLLGTRGNVKILEPKPGDPVLKRPLGWTTESGPATGIADLM